ncbi:MAG: energy transducer TonB [Bradyrhizobium sp.]
MDQDVPPELIPGSREDIDAGRAVTPKLLGFRQLIAIAIVTPVLMAAGVFWLHHLPTGTIARTSDSVIEVRLVPSQEPPLPSRDMSPQPPSPAAVSQPDPLVENPDRPVPTDSPANPAGEPKLTQPSMPEKKSDPSPPPIGQLQADRTATIFQRALLSHIARYRRYPDDARRDGIQGIATVLFAMRRDGTVAEVWVRSSSGNNSLDAAALDTIRRAEPLPRIPAELPDRLNVLIPVAFNLP